MRQVPEYGIVGDGRAARHVRHYLALLGIPVRSWSRRDPGAPPPDVLRSCSPVLLLIRDEAIVSFVEAWPALRGTRLVHFSGSLVTDVAEAAHPLMTFGEDVYDLQVYREMPFVLDTGRTPFAELLPGLPNHSFTIPASDRAYYHALCVMAGNFSTLLWQKLFREFETRLRIPASAAHPYARQIIANLLADPSRSLTGPLSRGDAHTIAANLGALDGDPFQDVYAAFVRAHDHRS